MQISLETISRALLGDELGGKYKGLTGPEFALSHNILDKRLYAFKDAELLLRCVALNNYELLQVVSALSELTEIKFRDICQIKGVGRIWADILDKLVEQKLSDIQSSTEPKDEYLFDTLAGYYDRKKGYNEYLNLLPSTGPRYIGGWIYEDFKPGTYKNVTVFDVASLYPTMIINNNISFDTVNCQCCDEDRKAKVSKELFKDKPKDYPIPHICRNHKGLLTIQVGKYMNERLRYKALAKQNPERRREFENKSNVYKILINSVYGQMGHKFAKYENVNAAELVTRFGQLTIKECARIAKEKMHWDIIYGDTDSLFINNSENIGKIEIAQFIEECKFLTHVDIELDKVYRSLLMSGSKTYLGITTDDKIVVKGLVGKKSRYVSMGP